MQGSSKPEILVTNDDGVNSPHIALLASALSQVGNVRVVAPASGQSGVSHAFTGFRGLKLLKVAGAFPFDFYSVSGTPSDSVKFALRELYKNVKIDVVFSGMNVGENAGVSSLYSGTIAGAREAALWGVPGIAISLSGASAFAKEESIRFALRVVEERLYAQMPSRSFWNVNFPDVSEAAFSGFRVLPMNLSMFTDRYIEKDGEWFLEGEKRPVDFLPHTDDVALSEGFAVVTPMTLDQTLSSEVASLSHTIDKIFGVK
ncbi:MAG: 5'/3'-nucleotidase SurE [Fibrobacteraceae bacterium]|nr:5'/3'-nucleotidase SurE [Fibrobacteraceae bacterium]